MIKFKLGNTSCWLSKKWHLLQSKNGKKKGEKPTHFVGMKTILLEPWVFREGIIITDGPLKAVNV